MIEPQASCYLWCCEDYAGDDDAVVENAVVDVVDPVVVAVGGRAVVETVVVGADYVAGGAAAIAGVAAIAAAAVAAGDEADAAND